ncbi:hydroxysteroid 11-beta-dehydrogenase 1-like protein isoform X1 [Centrocercus urophasianus]|uniref:hydroxysteroid 11-beta-dehydrogenase 1-like protein isoform X1 n=1 Tax=Centrocercus urophasianus TaxID=9002 RepID=UPI001C64C45B|nr:hydroxysteroid 11-beta-dehydrogenase 1-like protein isoform X1 [Centrocercus urophasianus]
MVAKSREREAAPAAIWGLSSFLFPFCTAWRKMKPFGKVLCAAGSLAVLLAFFWRDTFQPEQLSGARVLLTGASTGIGEQMAYHYATFGAEIVLTARREAVLQEVVEKCLSLGAKKAFYIPADMSSPSEPDRVLRFAVQKLGGLDYLVLNHIGISPFQMWGGDVEHSRWLMEVNFFSYVALATAALPTLEKNHGSVVVVSSLTGKIPTPFTTSYSATKFALDGFFSSLRHELMMQERNVSITLCILGLIDTATALEKTRSERGLTLMERRRDRRWKKCERSNGGGPNLAGSRCGSPPPPPPRFVFVGPFSFFFFFCFLFLFKIRLSLNP